MNVSDFMTKNVVVCNEEETVEHAAKIMLENSFSVLPIVNSEKELVGILTESDFVGKDANIPHALASIIDLFGQVYYFGDVEEVYKQARARKVKEVMSKKPTTVNSSTSLSEVVKRMNSKGLKRIPVVDEGKIVGIITRKDLLRAFEKIAS